MGKIFKFCTSCDEGFADKFGFCPNCGQALQTFEMNPVAPPPPVEESAAQPTVEAGAKPATKLPEPVAESVIELPVLPVLVADEAFHQPDVPHSGHEPVIDATEPEAATRTATAFFHPKPIDVDRTPVSLEAEHNAAVSEGAFYITVIEEKNVKQRNVLLLGTLGCMLVVLMGMTVYSLFAKDLGVGAIGGDIFVLANLVADPMAVEEEKQKKDKKEAGGGGGGGGNDDPNPASRGERAPMRTDPQFAPSVSMVHLTNPTIPIQMAIKGPIDEKKLNVDQYGVHLGTDLASDGPGKRGGQGGGADGGQGDNNGPGNGLGNNGGIGGPGNGGTGPGGNGSNGGAPPPPPPKHVGVTQNLSITSKPRPGYTDSARQANIQGTVILRVTFLANGQIGSISPVKGLPNGLTEQAIAAARRISFEPKKVDGVGQPVTRQIEYMFSIY